MAMGGETVEVRREGVDGSAMMDVDGAGVSHADVERALARFAAAAASNPSVRMRDMVLGMLRIEWQNDVCREA